MQLPEILRKAGKKTEKEWTGTFHFQKNIVH